MRPPSAPAFPRCGPPTALRMRRPYVRLALPVRVLALAGHRVRRALDRRRCHQVHLAFAGNVSRNLQHIHPPARQHRHREELRRRVPHQSCPRQRDRLLASGPRYRSILAARPPSLPSACGNCRACVRDTRRSVPTRMHPSRKPVTQPDRITFLRQTLGIQRGEPLLHHRQIHPAHPWIFQVRRPSFSTSSDVFYLHGGRLGFHSRSRHSSSVKSIRRNAPSPPPPLRVSQPRSLRQLPAPAPDQDRVRNAIIACELCPRLREYCARIGETRRRAYQDHDYWARPVPGFGDPARPRPHPRPRSRRARSQPHRPPLHRRRLRATSCTPCSTSSASPPNPAPSPATTACACATPGSAPSSAALRPATSPRPRRFATAPSISQPRSTRCPASASSSASARSPGTASSPISCEAGVIARRSDYRFAHAAEYALPNGLPPAWQLPSLAAQHQHRPPQSHHVRPRLRPRQGTRRSLNVGIPSNSLF